MHSGRLNQPRQRRITAAIIAALAFAAGGNVYAQQTPPGASVADVEEGVLEEVVVVGFRKSLEAALNIKRDSVGQVDAIVAEDIADWPDNNLAESLARIPGVTITRDSGEGRSITVRGLSGEYTMTRINGIEAIAATGGEGGPNRGRDFDYNVFASELFNQLRVTKTASAEEDEGSLGSIVDLYTGRPFGYEEGQTLVVNGQMQYNDLGSDWGPRIAALWAYHDPDGVWGASFSAAYSEDTTQELGQNTVRWQAAQFRSVNGVTCASNPTDPGCAEVTGGFHPRIPRYGLIQLDRERTGLTGGFQWAPSDATLVSVDLLWSEFEGTRGEKWGEVLFRGNERFMDVVDWTYDSAKNNLNSMTVNNAWVRNENFEKNWTTDFFQWGINFDHDFNDQWSMHALVGGSHSELDFPYEVTFMYDDRDYDGYYYDYWDDKYPVLTFGGPDVTNGANFQLSEVRDRPANVKHDFDVINFDVDWQINDNLTLKMGASYKQFKFDTNGYIRDTGVCAADLYDCDSDGDGTDDLYGVPATDAMSDIYHYPDRTGAGSTTSWAIPNLQAWIDYFDLFNLPAREDQNNVRNVKEKDTALFLQLDGINMLGNMEARWNVGLRWVETDQTSSGYNSGVWVTVDRDPYDDWLPSANFALSITEDLIWRISGAETMTRPQLGQLTPGGSVDAFNYRVSYQNPYLDPTKSTNFDTAVEWYFADEAAVSLAYFIKDIDSFPIRSERQGTYASTGLPLSLLNPTSPAGQCPECQPWTISTLDNGPGADVDGFEFGIQFPFDTYWENVSFVRNLGFIGNYTWVDSNVDYTFGSQVITETLLGLSKDSWNATLYYETDTINARIAYSYRGDYISGTSGTGNIFEGYGPISWLDFSARYTFNDNWQVTFEALNLTDEYQDRWVDIYTDRRYEWDHTGRVYKVGFRYAF